MSKKEERAKLAKAVESDDFKKCCEDMGFSVCSTAEEGKSKKKANI